MADERMIKILLSMGVDEAGARRALDQFQKFQKSLGELEKEAQMIKKSISVALSAGKDTKELEQELERIEAVMREIRKQGEGGFRRAFDEQLQAAQKTREELEKASAAQAQMARDARDNAYNLRDIGEKLSRVGQYFSGVGTAILSPLTQASQLFLSTAAQSDPLVVRWKSEMGEIQDAWLRIGRVATEELLPLLEDASDFVSALADFVEAHPELIKIAIGSGIGLKGAGEALQAAGSTAMLLGSLKQLGWLGAGGASAGGATLASAGGMASAAVIVPIVATTLTVLAGIGIGAFINDKLIQPAFGGVKSNQAATVGAFWFGQTVEKITTSLGLLSPEEAKQKTDVFVALIGKITGAIDENSPIWQRAQASMPKTREQRGEIITQAQLDAFAALEDAQNKRKQYEQQSEEARNAIVAEFGARRAEMEQSYENQRGQIIAQYAEQRAKAVSAFALSERRIEQDYYRQRREAAARHGLEIRRAEEDHQRELRKLQRDHNRRVRDLVDERDALGLVREQQAYEDQRRESEESHRIEMRRRNEDYALQLRDMEENFALQRQRRLEDFQRQQQELAAQQQARLAQLDAQHALELQKLAEQEKARLEQFDKNYKAELEQLKSAEQQRLNILRSLALNDHSALQRAGMELTARYRAWLQQAAQSFLTPAPASVPIRGRASGGWVNSGAPYWVGERGPELMIPHTSGNIIPTHRILSGERGNTVRTETGGVNMRIETSSLTLHQVIREIDKRLTRNNRALAKAFA